MELNSLIFQIIVEYSNYMKYENKMYRYIIFFKEINTLFSNNALN